MSEPGVVKELNEIEGLFAQTAQSAEHVDGRNFRCSVRPSAPSFSDWPQHVVCHIGMSEFVGIWGDGENSFAADPPNAVLAFFLLWHGISATGSVGPRR